MLRNSNGKEIIICMIILPKNFKIVNKNFNVNLKNQGIMGHSMGGMGSLVCGVLNKKIFKSISAFAPICDPSKSAFSYNAFTKYLAKK